MLDIVTLGNNIKKHRRRKKLTQNELAVRVRVTPQSVSKWESGISVPSIDNICFLSDIFDVSIDELIGNQKNHSKIMIGVDGGSKKTEFVMFSDEWTILDRIELGPCNPNTVGAEESAAVLKRGIAEMMDTNVNISGVYLGCSGFSIGSNEYEVIRQIKSAFPNVRLGHENNILNVIASATTRDTCIAVVCGAGSNVYVKERERSVYLTGWGYLLSKSGTGFDIGRDALYATLQDREGLGRHTAITELVESRLGSSVKDAVHEIYSKDQSYIASFAPIVLQTYQAGDRIAEDILNENAARIADIINFAAKTYDCGNEVILAGSMFTGSGIFADLVRSRLAYGIRVTIPKTPQVYGACVLCAQMCGVSTENSSEIFLEQYRKILAKAEQRGI